MTNLRIATWAGALLAALLLARPAWSLQGPENVAVVVNDDSWASRRVANEYVRLRNIPDGNIVHLSGLPDIERMGVEDFRERILKPVLNQLNQRGLAAQIDAVVYSADLPTTIDVRGDFGDRKMPRVLTSEASINGLTFLYPLVLGKDVRYLDLNANRYARRMVRSSEDTPWTQAEQQRLSDAQERLINIGRRRREQEEAAAPADDAAEQRRQLESVHELLAELRRAHPRSADLLYQLACVEAQLERLDDAIGTLNSAVEHGWFDHRRASADRDLRALRERPEFKTAVERMKAIPLTVQPPRAFHGVVGWSAEGQPVAPDAGPRYLLSTVLTWTSGRGLSVAEGLEQLRRSVSADGTRPAGTIYFPTNGDIRSTTREWGFQPTAAALEKLGVRAVVESGVLPRGRADVAGAVIGTAGFDWKQSGSTIVPGAICEHLTSFGGMLRQDDGQTPLTEFLRHGAAGSSGTVTEPFAIQAKFPTPFIQEAYAQGLTLGEAFYQSVAGPYQLLIVGDVLCRPWGTKVELDVEGAPADGVWRGPVALKVRVKVDDKPGERPPGGLWIHELYVDGVRRAIARDDQALTVDTNALADGRHDVALTTSSVARIGTVGRWTSTALIRNHEAVLTTRGPEQPNVRWDQAVTLHASLPKAEQIQWRSQNAVVGQLAATDGDVTIDPRLLGAGPVRLQPVGRVDGREVWGEPVELTVVPPPALPPAAPPPGQTFKDGPLVRVAEGKAVVAARAQGDWLEKAGVAADSIWTLDAWFEVPTTEVYQFQLQGNVSVTRMTVDDQPLELPRGTPLSFVPVHLAAGLHHLKMEAGGTIQPRLDVRFGGPGTRWLEGSRFRHPE